jgi:hypothetical protein
MVRVLPWCNPKTINQRGLLAHLGSLTDPNLLLRTVSAAAITLEETH